MKFKGFAKHIVVTGAWLICLVSAVASAQQSNTANPITDDAQQPFHSAPSKTLAIADSRSSSERFSLVKPLKVTKRQTFTYRGDAYDMKSGDLLYRELHTVYLQNEQPRERRVRYERANGELLASKTTRYGENPFAPDFTLSDARDGYQEEAYQDGNRRRLTLKESALSKPQTDRLKSPALTAVVDAGFDEFVRSRWDSLLQGKSASFSFAVPSRQEYIDFRLVPTKVTNDSLEVEMRLKSRLLAWLLDPIKLTYGRDNKLLMRYRGLTNIRDDNGRSISADIRYRYPEVTR